MILQQSK